MIVAAAAGLLAAVVFQEALFRASLSRLTLQNYRGRIVKVVGGLVILPSVLTAEIVASVGGQLAGEFRTGLLLLSLGFFALGLLDDAVGDRSNKGLGGHLKALLHGRVTTGALKAFGGLALAALVSLVWEDTLLLAALNTLVIALAANLLNLFDLRPGRTAKLYLLLWLPLVAAAQLVGSEAFLEVSAAMTGATVVWLVADLRERGMLGDSGANMLGAMLGAGVVLTLGAAGRTLVLAVLVALTLASEAWSFSKIIDAVGPLRWFDRLGRLGTRN